MLPVHLLDPWLDQSDPVRIRFAGLLRPDSSILPEGIQRIPESVRVSLFPVSVLPVSIIDQLLDQLVFAKQFRLGPSIRRELIQQIPESALLSLLPLLVLPVYLFDQWLDQSDPVRIRFVGLLRLDPSILPEGIRGFPEELPVLLLPFLVYTDE